MIFYSEWQRSRHEFQLSLFVKINHIQSLRSDKKFVEYKSFIRLFDKLLIS